MSGELHGHPREPSEFTFSETVTGPDGYRRTTLSYVAYDSRWPWWRQALAKVIAATRNPPQRGKP